jgi:hypothetical protein
VLSPDIERLAAAIQAGEISSSSAVN